MFRNLHQLYDFLSCLVRWRGAVYVWRPQQNYLYIFNKKLFHIFYDERTKWFMESQEKVFLIKWGEKSGERYS
jgi:hypothetical protein